jgi:hypothetical protein
MGQKKMMGLCLGYACGAAWQARSLLEIFLQRGAVAATRLAAATHKDQFAILHQIFLPIFFFSSLSTR